MIITTITINNAYHQTIIPTGYNYKLHELLAYNCIPGCTYVVE